MGCNCHVMRSHYFGFLHRDLTELRKSCGGRKTRRDGPGEKEIGHGRPFPKWSCGVTGEWAHGAFLLHGGRVKVSAACYGVNLAWAPAGGLVSSRNGTELYRAFSRRAIGCSAIEPSFRTLWGEPGLGPGRGGLVSSRNGTEYTGRFRVGRSGAARSSPHSGPPAVVNVRRFDMFGAEADADRFSDARLEPGNAGDDSEQ